MPVPGGLFVALLLFETQVSGQAASYTEELYLLKAAQLTGAQTQAEARGRTEECAYNNAAGEAVFYRFLHVVDVQPVLFPTDEGLVYTRSFVDLSAYREVASLREPLEHATVSFDDLPALAKALESVFGAHFHVVTEPEGLGFHWKGRGFGGLGVKGMQASTVASAALSTAHDIVLESMGEDGEHPGALVHATSQVSAVAKGWQLSLVAADGTVLHSAVWITG